MVGAAALGLCGVVRAWLMGPMWLDQSFIPLQYSAQIASGNGLGLPGQEVAIEAFTNPIWVGLFGALGSLNLHEAQMQAPVGILLYGLLMCICTWQIWSRHGRWVAILPVVLLLLAPVVAVARDGSDGMWLAVWSVVAAVGVGTERDGLPPQKKTRVALFVLSVSGVFGVLVSLGLAWMTPIAQRRQNLRLVICGLGGVIALRWVFFGTWLPPLFVGPETGLEAFKLMPICVGLGLLGIVLGWSQRPQTMPLAWVVIVGAVYALATGQAEHGFGQALIPVMGAVTVLASNVFVAHQSALWSVLLIAASVVFDVRQTEEKVSQVAHVRMSDFLQSRGMGRFLLWRFEADDWVVVHKPGAVPYYSRRPVVDLSGRLHGRTISLDEALDHEPVAVLPDRKMVSNKAQRLVMPPVWPERLEQRYNQYAIQHQKQWQMVAAHPVWFHLYIRRDLPMLRADIPKSNGNILPSADPFGSQEADP
jgi:hypothetical protein